MFDLGVGVDALESTEGLEVGFVGSGGVTRVRVRAACVERMSSSGQHTDGVVAHQNARLHRCAPGRHTQRLGAENGGGHCYMLLLRYGG